MSTSIFEYKRYMFKGVLKDQALAVLKLAHFFLKKENFCPSV